MEKEGPERLNHLPKVTQLGNGEEHPSASPSIQASSSQAQQCDPEPVLFSKPEGGRTPHGPEAPPGGVRASSMPCEPKASPGGGRDTEQVKCRDQPQASAA